MQRSKPHQGQGEQGSTQHNQTPLPTASGTNVGNGSEGENHYDLGQDPSVGGRYQ